MPNHTIAENLVRLQNAKTVIGNAITAKGGTVNSGDGLEEFPNDIETIETNITTKTVTNTNTVNFVSNGDNLLDCNIKGNMNQSGTPSPTTPIQPQETGERTGNLYDYQTMTVSGLSLYNSSRVTSSDIATIMIVPCEAETTYTVSVQGVTITVFRVAITDNETIAVNTPYTKLVDSPTEDFTYTLTTTASTKNILIQINNVEQSKFALMVNKGSTALPYEPYGYKIPISSANITTPVYLGEVQTTRKIKKLVFDGTESWNKNSQNRMYISLSDVSIIGTIPICSHFIGTAAETYSGLNDGECTNSQTSGGTNRFACYYSSITDYTEFKTWLAEQYAAGTPVTVWYVLAEPTTGIVNEPLRKIGDYADSVSASNIPTTLGQTNLIVNTTLEPSEIYIKYRYIENIKLLGTKTITENGTYNASTDNLDGYSSVNVNVPIPAYINTTIEAVNDSLLESLEGNL